MLLNCSRIKADPSEVVKSHLKYSVSLKQGLTDAIHVLCFDEIMIFVQEFASVLQIRRILEPPG